MVHASGSVHCSPGRMLLTAFIGLDMVDPCVSTLESTFGI